MSLAERLTMLEHDEQVCKMGAIIKEMDAETKIVFLRVLKSKVSTRVLTFELNDAGLDVGRSSVGLHRAGRCSCRSEE